MTKINWEIRKVVCVKRVLEYKLTRKNVKNINLRMKPDGTISVSAKSTVPAEYIDNFIKEKQDYIISILEKYEEALKDKPVTARNYISGESFTILGEDLCLKVIEGTKESVYIENSDLYLVVRNKNDFAQKEKLINLWLRELQIKIFHEISTQIHQDFIKYNIPYPQIKIRYMTSRWGTCHTTKGIITLNSRLIEMSRKAIEYVVLHEFAHFIHPNHSKNFYDFVELLMPDWRERKKELVKRG